MQVPPTLGGTPQWQGTPSRRLSLLPSSAAVPQEGIFIWCDRKPQSVRNTLLRASTLNLGLVPTMEARNRAHGLSCTVFGVAARAVPGRGCFSEERPGPRSSCSLWSPSPRDRRSGGGECQERVRHPVVSREREFLSCTFKTTCVLKLHVLDGLSS